MALGHLMLTAGFGKEQFFWCNICCAHTGDRVRNLAKDCDRVARITVKVVNSLRKDEHPSMGTMLTVRARRMLKADIGGKLALLEPPGCTMANDLLLADSNDNGSQTALSDVWCHALAFLSSRLRKAVVPTRLQNKAMLSNQDLFTQNSDHICCNHV